MCACVRACPTLWALASSSFSLSYPFSRTSITEGLRSRDRLSLKALHSSPSSPDRKLPSAESASRPGTLQHGIQQDYRWWGKKVVREGSGRKSEGRHLGWISVFSLPSIVAVPWSGVNWLRGELVSSKGRGEARRRCSERVGAVQRSGWGAVTSRSLTLLCLVLQDDTHTEPLWPLTSYVYHGSHAKSGTLRRRSWSELWLISICMWWGNGLTLNLPEGQVWWVRPS